MNELKYRPEDIRTCLNLLNTFQVSGADSMRKLLYIIQTLEQPIEDEEETDGKRN